MSDGGGADSTGRTTVAPGVFRLLNTPVARRRHVAPVPDSHDSRTCAAAAANPRLTASAATGSAGTASTGTASTGTAATTARSSGTPATGSAETATSLAPGASARDRAHSAALDAVAASLREQAVLWGRRQRLLVALLGHETEAGASGRPQFGQLELAGSCSVSQITATRLVADALRLVDVLSRTLAQVEAGLLLQHQAEVLLVGTRHCTVEIAQAVEDEVLPGAAALYPSDLRKRVARAVLRAESADPVSAEQRHADAAADRHVHTRPEPDGMGSAGALLTAEQLVSWSSGLDALERRERAADLAAGVRRTVAQRKADLFAALPAMVLAGTAADRSAANPCAQPCANPCANPCARPCGAAVSPPPPLAPWTLGPEQLAAQVVLHVHVPYSTVLDLSHEPGTLDGYGPLGAEHVRLLRPTAYQRVLVDGRTGRPLGQDPHPTPAAPTRDGRRRQVQQLAVPQVLVDRDEPQHDPSARLARLVDLRDAHCCGPGCSSTRTDRDHHVPYPRGSTSARNLDRLSRRCHRAKHHGWTLTRYPDGSVTWRSPLGRAYDRPSPWPAPPPVDPFQEPPVLRDPVDPTTWVTQDDGSAEVDVPDKAERPSSLGPSTAPPRPASEDPAPF